MILVIFMIQVGIADNTGTIEPANEKDWPIVAITTGQRYSSMTTPLTHTDAHSTKPSFRPKTNNQPLKKFLSFALS